MVERLTLGTDANLPARKADSDRTRMRSKVMLRGAEGQPDRFLLAQMGGSAESADSYTKLNCGGFGRVRKFTQFSIHLATDRFPETFRRPNFRGLPPTLPYSTQVFQLAGCNWDCWYCFVDDSMLEGRRTSGEFLSAGELVDLALAELDGSTSAPLVLDLSGGQPDLVPEWTLQVLREVEKRSIDASVWVDDNLSGMFLWRFLDDSDVQFLANSAQHSRMGCIKGFDAESFAFNTRAPLAAFDRHLAVAERLILSGFEMSFYLTLTSRHVPTRKAVSVFVERLAEIHPLLPLKVIPLEVRPYSAVATRLEEDPRPWIKNQYLAVEYWEDELLERFGAEGVSRPLDSIHFNVGRNV